MVAGHVVEQAVSLAADTVAYQQQLEMVRVGAGDEDQLAEDLVKARARMERSWLSSLPVQCSEA